MTIAQASWLFNVTRKHVLRNQQNAGVKPLPRDAAPHRVVCSRMLGLCPVPPLGDAHSVLGPRRPPGRGSLVSQVLDSQEQTAPGPGPSRLAGLGVSQLLGLQGVAGARAGRWTPGWGDCRLPLMSLRPSERLVETPGIRDWQGRPSTRYRRAALTRGERESLPRAHGVRASPFGRWGCRFGRG